MPFTRLEHWPPKHDDSSQKSRYGSVLSLESKEHPENRYITSQIAVHDRTQLETVFDYSLVPEAEQKGKALRYEVEAFIFFPRQMGVKPHNYPKERFYSDLRPLIRLREPVMSYKQLMGSGEDSGRSPMGVVRDFISHVGRGGDAENERMVVDEARLFACTFVSYYLQRIERRAKKVKKSYRRRLSAPISDQESAAEFLSALDKAEDALRKSYSLLRAWRSLVKSAGELPEGVAKQLRAEVKFVDEYMAYRFRDGLARMIRTFNSIDPLAAGPEYRLLQKKLAAYTRLEHWYSDKSGFAWVDRGSSTDDVENYVYRRGALKRRVWSVLYLAVRTRPLFAFQQQLGAMIAAGLAAFWAVATEIVIRARAMAEGQSLFQGLSGGGLVLITAFILAYVLKDRIKEMGRSYFRSGPFVKIPDNSERIWFETSGGQKWQIGNIFEYTKFVSPSQIPTPVKELRAKADPDGLESDDAPEDVIRYRKVIHLRPDILDKYFYPIKAVHDILRLNVHAFLSKLDDPEQATEMLDPGGRVIEMKMPKVYHMDLILKYSRIGETISNTQAVYDHIRLVINKKGLYRIERLS